jgi:hypothetical protein
MKKFYFIFALILLMFNGISAIYGGWSLIKDPTGGLLQLPVEWLQYSPFKDFLIPGIILFIFNGLFSLAIFVLTLMKHRHYELLIIFQGGTLVIWIVVQVIMLQTIYFLHWLCGGLGILLVSSGWFLFSKK